MRLDKFLVHVGIGTRKTVKLFIKQKRITVNGEVVTKNDQKIDELVDDIALDHNTLKYQKYVYIMLHKPSGVISATEDSKHQTVLDLLDDKYQMVFPVGRLDKDTEGLLLLTNDGQLAHQLLSPRKHVDKTYYAVLRDDCSIDAVSLFEKGIILNDGYHCLPAKLTIDVTDKKQVRLVIQEGKFHQVKRMFESIGNKVVYLKRESMANLTLDTNLQLGEYRELTDDELAKLQSLFMPN